MVLRCCKDADQEAKMWDEEEEEAEEEEEEAGLWMWCISEQNTQKLNTQGASCRRLRHAVTRRAADGWGLDVS